MPDDLVALHLRELSVLRSRGERVESHLHRIARFPPGLPGWSRKGPWTVARPRAVLCLPYATLPSAAARHGLSLGG